MSITVRPALLDDSHAISGLFRAQVSVWQRMAPNGAVENLPYEHLTLHERWTHGGAWMSVETGAVHLSRLLRGIAFAYVAENEGEIVGYVEAYPGDEPAPYGRHLHVAHLMMTPEYFTAADALMRHLIAEAGRTKRPRITVSLGGQSDEMADFYSGYGFAEIGQVTRYTLATREGQVFYRVSDLKNAGAGQIGGWHMPVGRTESAAQHWEALMPSHWTVIPQVAEERVFRLVLNVGGQDSFVHLKQHAYDARNLMLSLWAQKPLTPQILSALRDWSTRNGYRTLSLVVDETTARLFGAEGESDPFRRTLYALEV
jgi:hypothetical protein